MARVLSSLLFVGKSSLLHPQTTQPRPPLPSYPPPMPATKLRLSRSIIIKSYALANLINGISLAAIQIHNDSLPGLGNYYYF